MGDKNSDFFNSTIDVKQGFPLSPALFSLFIDDYNTLLSSL